MSPVPCAASAVLRVLLVCTLAPFSAGADAQVYKCVDRSGKVVYLQSPCPAGAKSEPVKQTVSPAPQSAAPASAGAAKGDKAAKAAKGGPKSTAELEQEFRKRRTGEQEAAKKQQEELAQSKQKEQNCSNARAQLAGLEAGGRQMRFNEKGERSFLDDAQIEQEKAKARQSVAQFCK